jgi:hypothetical protein
VPVILSVRGFALVSSTLAAAAHKDRSRCVMRVALLCCCWCAAVLAVLAVHAGTHCVGVGVCLPSEAYACINPECWGGEADRCAGGAAVQPLGRQLSQL